MPGHDVAVLGGGGAGTLVLLALARLDLPLRVAVVDPAPRRGWDRTWCFWSQGPSLVDDAVAASWGTLAVAGGGRPRQVLDLAPLTYRLVRSDALYALARRRLAAAHRLRVADVRAAAGRVVEDATGAVVETAAGPVRARWVLDSRPGPPARPGSVSWVQSFLGHVLAPGAAPPLADVPVFMDFRTRPPGHGLSFGYCLPLGEGAALIEYTEFGPRPLDPGRARESLAEYVSLLGGDRDASPLHVETGAIPMIDAPFPRRAGRRWFRLGTAGGATRPATGYTFSAMIRQAEAVAEALAQLRPPVPPPPYPSRHRVMDALLLRALDDGLIDGPGFFRDLFAAQPAARVLDFLDGRTGMAGDLQIMRSSPSLSMVRAGIRAALPPR